MTMQTTSLNNAQLEILDMMSFVKSQEALADLKQAISNYFASELEKEMNRMWETGEMTEEKVENFRTIHERTPYK
ncbi:MAG: dephospho-CoA kinase [Paludibacteraceae bacterium]|nr:dephospho-CoA kinase [Paludibacteraceae bacterium]